MNDSLDMDMKLMDEIIDGASRLPPDRQERILEVIKAMLFTRKVIMEQERESMPAREIGHEV